MTPRDWFGVVLRTVGLLLILGGAGYLLVVLGMLLNPMLAVPGMSRMLIPPLLSSLGALVAGVYLLGGAPGLIGFSYPERGPAS